MKSQKPHDREAEPESFGFVAGGIAGCWEVAVDETFTGSQRWFAQIEGPSCYLYFQIPHPRIMEEMLDFLIAHPENGLQVPTCHAMPHNGELEVSQLGGNAVSLISDDDRCVILISGKDDLRVRVSIAGSDRQEIIGALRQLRDELCHAGLLAEHS